jgi:hypothetical protein
MNAINQPIQQLYITGAGQPQDTSATHIPESPDSPQLPFNNFRIQNLSGDTADQEFGINRNTVH